MRAPVDHIPAPAFPAKLPWFNVAALRMDQQRGRPVLIEFWDFCRPNSIRTLPYIKAWHERYEPHGLRVISVHAAGFEPSADPDEVGAAVERLGIEHAVMVDVEHALWQEYENLGWPARYLVQPGRHALRIPLRRGRLRRDRAGDPGAAWTLDGDRPARPPRGRARRADQVQSDDAQGAYSGPYEAGAVWAVLDGEGTVTTNGRELQVTHPGAYQLIDHEYSTAGVLDLQVGDGVTCHATIFTPGPAGPGVR